MMSSPLADVTHYTLSTHPRNPSIIDLTERATEKLAFIKIRHKIPEGYSISLVDPKTFVPFAESQSKNATVRSRSIVLRDGAVGTNSKGVEVLLKETSLIGFEWTFEWENQRYRWVRESVISNTLECRCTRKTGNVCVAKYMPRGVKNGYFGLLSLLGFNLAGLESRRGLEIVLCMTLLILLDKSADASAAGWLLPIKRNNATTTTSTEFSAKEQQRLERESELKLQQLLERNLRRSQKQIVHDDQIKSASNSPSHSPQVSPVPTPTVSTDYKSLLRHSIKHLDATATLQLPNAAAAPYTNLEALFAPHPQQQQQQQQQQKQQQKPSASSSMVVPAAETAATTAGTAISNPTSGHHHRHHQTQQQQQQRQQQQQTSYSTVHDPRSYYYYYSNTEAPQQPFPSSSRHNSTTQRPRSYRRLSTGDQIVHYYQPSMRPYPPSSGLNPSQQHPQQRYSTANDYYYMYC